MKDVINMYKSAYKLHGDSSNAVLYPDGRRELYFGALTTSIYKKCFSVLDYGCGLAHLKEYLDLKYKQFSYTGVDIVDDFINSDKKKHPDAHFMQIKDYSDVVENYDYVLISGTFNILYSDNVAEHQRMIKDTLSYLFSKTNVMLSVNFMTDQVDFVQGKAYHQNVAEIQKFVSENLSRRFIIDHSYMPYEYTVSIFKDDNILVSNIYASLKKLTSNE